MGISNSTFFLVIEGIDGSGKSTITRRLVKILESTFHKNVKLTFEPHDPSCAGLFIRQILMRQIADVPPWTLALAFAVNRADHCDREITPFLNQTNGMPRLVVCDRYYLSSLVYQSNDKLSFDDIMALNTQVRRPDLTIFLNASSTTCYERMRNRQESKELFERNLSHTKNKYTQAIEYLKNFGEKIVEIQADGSMSDVISKIIEVLVENSPEWLTIQQSLLIDEEQHVFEPTNSTIQSIVESYTPFWTKGPLLGPDELAADLSQLENNISRRVQEMSFNDAATLCLDFISLSGYAILDRLPWTDLDAFGLQFKMPLGILQRGAVLLLGESQRYNMVIPKLLTTQKFSALKTMTDFLFIFDSTPAHLTTSYYEREILAGSSSLSPSLFIVGRKQIADLIFSKALDALQAEHMYTLRSLKALNETFGKFYKKTLSSLNCTDSAWPSSAQPRS